MASLHHYGIRALACIMLFHFLFHQHTFHCIFSVSLVHVHIIIIISDCYNHDDVQQQKYCLALFHISTVFTYQLCSLCKVI